MYFSESFGKQELSMEESLNGNRLYDSVHKYSLTRKGLEILAYEEDSGFVAEIPVDLYGKPGAHHVLSIRA